MPYKRKFIPDNKRRGEWAESVFMARANEQGLPVSKPWGDSRSYDFVVGAGREFVSVQVKSTIYKVEKGYECTVRSSSKYAAGSFDFLAAYVIPEDEWYIIPGKLVAGKDCIMLYPKRKTSKYEPYREAWELLREASRVSSEGSGAGETGTEDSAEAGSVGDDRPPTSALGRMEAAMNFFKQKLERGTDPQKR